MKRIAHTKALRQAMDDELANWAKETSRILKVAVPEKRAEMIRGRLVLNIARGEDKAVQSCKLLGKDREVHLFEPDNQIGIEAIVSGMPEEWRADFERFEGDGNQGDIELTSLQSQDREHPPKQIEGEFKR